MTLKNPLLIAAILVLASCATVEQAHLDAWQQVAVADLESHPLWGVPDQKIDLSTGDSAYVYYTAEPAIGHAITEDITVIRSPVCKFIFLISKGKVQSMTTRGQCWTSPEQMPRTLPLPAAPKAN